LGDTNDSSQSESEIVLEPSFVKLTAKTQPLLLDVVVSDPAPLKGWTLLRLEIGSKLRRVLGKLFGTSKSPSAG
jgi:hypothetical protein